MKYYCMDFEIQCLESRLPFMLDRSNVRLVRNVYDLYGTEAMDAVFVYADNNYRSKQDEDRKRICMVFARDRGFLFVVMDDSFQRVEYERRQRVARIRL